MMTTHTAVVIEPKMTISFGLSLLRANSTISTTSIKRQIKQIAR